MYKQLRIMELQDMINNNKKLIKKYDNVIRFAIKDSNCSIDDIEKIKKRRDSLMGELTILQMFNKNKK